MATYAKYYNSHKQNTAHHITSTTSNTLHIIFVQTISNKQSRTKQIDKSMFSLTKECKKTAMILVKLQQKMVFSSDKDECYGCDIQNEISDFLLSITLQIQTWIGIIF
jgi:hypothetical protein